MSDFGSGSQGSVSGTVQQAVDTVQDKAGQVVDQAQDAAGQVVDQARQTVTTQASSQKDRAVESLTVLAQAVRQTGDQLRSQEQRAVAGYTDTAARYIEQVSSFLRDRDINEMIYDVERYARRNPTTFIGGAFTLGLLAGRFLKSSSQASYQGSGSQYRSPAGGSRSYTYSSYGAGQGTTGGSYGVSSARTDYGTSGGYGAGTGVSGMGASGSGVSGMGTTGTGASGMGTTGTGASLGGQTRLTDADTSANSSEQFSARTGDL